jgi:hypothetical protein
MAEEKKQDPQKIEPKIEPSVETKTYEVHIKIPNEMRTVLQTAAVLAHKMGNISKPELASLMSLYIAQGLAIQKRKWLNRMGLAEPK